MVGFLAGAPFRMGAEDAAEFDENLAPSKEYGELLGHSIFFHVKDCGHPVAYVPPAFALLREELLARSPKLRKHLNVGGSVGLYWVEYGGRLDTIHQSDEIKWELWRFLHAAWDHIKNSGRFPNVETLALEWVGTIAGKRESRRFEGDFLLSQLATALQAGIPAPDALPTFFETGARGSQDFCRQHVYAEHVAAYEAAGIPFHILTVDHGWSVAEGDWRPDPR